MTHSAKPKVQGKPNEAHEETIEQTAEELQLRGAALERHSEHERAELLSGAVREQAALRTEQCSSSATSSSARSSPRQTD